MLEKQKELYQTRISVLENPESHTKLTDPNTKLSVRLKLRTLNSHIRHDVNVQENTILRDKYLELLSPIDEDEVNYYIMHTFLSEKHNNFDDTMLKSMDIFNDINQMNDIIPINGMGQEKQLIDKIVNFFQDCCDTGQFSNFNKSDLLNKINTIKKDL